LEEKKYIYVDGKKTRIEDLTGKKFSRLTVVSFDKDKYVQDSTRKKNGEIKQVQKRWLCNCECGTENISINSGNLISGHTKSCGCLAIENKRSFAEDLSNQRFGRLLVIERDYIKEEEVRLKNTDHNVFWKCKCDCGNYKTIQSGQLKSSSVNSCGCLNSEVASKNRIKRAIKENGSLGDWIIKNLSDDFLIKYWSKKNKKSPFKMASRGISTKIHIICDKCGKEYSVNPNEFVVQGKRCSCCKTTIISKGENRISEFLINNNINFNPQQTFDGLLGIGNGLLSYDFYLKKHNLLIEYQGQFHDGTAPQQTDDGYKTQIEHDKRKREYAKTHNILLLEIWYWDFDNIEKIIKRELKLN